MPDAFAVGVDARLFVYPPADPVFRREVETTLAPLAGRPVEDVGVLAAAAALLRTTYPQATIQSRGRAAAGRRAAAWDVFRDEAALDAELAHRARAGMPEALAQLYDRHHALAYSVAARVAGPLVHADDAVVAAFTHLLEPNTGVAAIRVGLAALAVKMAMATLTPAERLERAPVLLQELPAIVVELALRHRLTRHEIATVLELDVAEVGRLAAAAFSRARASGGATDADGGIS
jgi:hypothetical protein